MKAREVIILDSDMDRLTRLVHGLRHSLFRDQRQVESLDRVLETADVRSSHRFPRNTVRMTSHAAVRDLQTQEAEVYKLVFPENADMTRNQISVLAPVGIALLGRKCGDIIEAKTPGGTRRLKIERVLHEPKKEEPRVQEGRTHAVDNSRNNAVQNLGLAA